MTIYDLIKVNKLEIVNMVSKINLNYSSFPIIRSNGKKRWIDAPSTELKQIQKNILYNFLYKFKAHQRAFGFKKGVALRTGAEEHLGAKAVLTMDIKNFFPTIKEHAIRAKLIHLFERYAKIYNSTVVEKEKQFSFQSEDIDNIVSIVCYKGAIPQGAPTSPALANLIFYTIDQQINNVIIKPAKDKTLIYTRYADDITISSKNKSFYKISKSCIYTTLRRILETNGFKVNHKKTRVRYSNNRMLVTGIVINDSLSVPRWKWRNFKAKLHNLYRDNETINIEEYQKLRGYVEWIKTLNPKRGQKFLTMLGKITVKN